MGNSEVKRMNLFNQPSEIDELTRIQELKLYMDGGNLRHYTHHDWLYDSVNRTLNHREMDVEKPVSFIDSLYDVFVKDFKYSGKVYRGFINDYDYESDDELKSFSTKRDTALDFSNCDIIYGDGLVIEQTVLCALDLTSFLQKLCSIDDRYKDICEEYFSEKEVLCCIQSNHRIVYKNGEKVN